MKILVVGFPRSGTTLTFRIFRDHPEVKQMFFEKWMLRQTKTKKELLQKFPVFKNDICGEKVIYAKRVIGKIGKSDFNIVDYCHKWNKWFGKEARIIQIVRHPYDSLNSLLLSKKRFPRGPAFKKVYREYLDYIPKYTLQINSIPNCMTIKYEDLLFITPAITMDLYKHCNIHPLHIHPEKIKVGRLFNYKRNGLLFEYDPKLENVIDTFNKLKGIKYEKSI